ncbi:hypothetical protein MMC29_001962, partial [Sticta canariensis]|nr:hypothetical protein [Sticta canariensis]
MDAITSVDEITTLHGSIDNQSPLGSARKKKKRKEPIRLATKLTQQAIYQQYGSGVKRAKMANLSASDHDE